MENAVQLSVPSLRKPAKAQIEWKQIATYKKLFPYQH